MTQNYTGKLPFQSTRKPIFQVLKFVALEKNTLQLFSKSFEFI